MRRNPMALFLAACLGALLPMLMAPTGGYPSRPTFQTVNVTGLYTHTTAANVGDTIAQGKNTSTGNSASESLVLTNNLNVSAILSQAGGSATTGLPTDLPTGSAFLVSNAATPLCLGTEYAAQLCIDGSGNIATTAATGTVPWSKTYSLIANVAGAGPTMVSCTNCGANSIARSAAGIYSITIAPGVLVTWACGMRNVSGNAPGVEVSLGSVSSTTIPVDLFNFAGALADGAAGTQISCTGAL